MEDISKSYKKKWDEICKSIHPVSGNGVNFLTSDNRLFSLKDSIEKNTIIEILCKNSISLNNIEVLDLGCGTGRLSFFFEKIGAKVIGVDISEEFLKIARENKEKLNSNVNFIQSDLIGFLKSKDYLNSNFIVLSGILCCHDDQQVNYIIELLRSKIIKKSNILIKEHIPSRKPVAINISGIELFFRTKQYWKNVLKNFDRKIEFYSCDLYSYSIMKKFQIYDRIIELIHSSKSIKALISPIDFILNKVRSYFIFLK